MNVAISGDDVPSFEKPVPLNRRELAETLDTHQSFPNVRRFRRCSIQSHSATSRLLIPPLSGNRGLWIGVRWPRRATCRNGAEKGVRAYLSMTTAGVWLAIVAVGGGSRDRRAAQYAALLSHNCFWVVGNGYSEMVGEEASWMESDNVWKVTASGYARRPWLWQEVVGGGSG